MDDIWLFSLAAIGALACLQCIPLIVLTCDIWRFLPHRLGDTRGRKHGKRVAVLAPCKGADVGLDANLRALFEQDYTNYEIHFVVESRHDPACSAIQRMMACYPRVDARIVEAGRANHSGQKVHNLLAAVENLPAQIEYLAFVDSDARPKAHWLRMLLRRLDQPRVGATTGYRCLEPTRCTFANLLVYSVNNFIVALYGAGGRHPVWGGSWAICREVFESVGLRQAWIGTLSDDFVATRVLHGAGLRVEFEPACMVASPLDSSLPQTMEFMRRQYMMGRLYTKFWYSVALATSTIATLGFWGNFAALTYGWATQSAWAWIPGYVCLALYGLTSLRNGLRNALVRRMLPGTTPISRAAARFDTWLGPITGLINWLGLSSALLGRGVTWRGIRYQMSPDGRVRHIADEDATPFDTAEQSPATPSAGPPVESPVESQAAVWQSVLSRSP